MFNKNEIKCIFPTKGLQPAMLCPFFIRKHCPICIFLLSILQYKKVTFQTDMRISLPNPRANPCALYIELKYRINNTWPKAKWHFYLLLNAMCVVCTQAKFDSNLIRKWQKYVCLKKIGNYNLNGWNITRRECSVMFVVAQEWKIHSQLDAWIFNTVLE